MLNQRMLCRAFRPLKLRKKRKSTQPPTGAKRRDRQFSLVGRQISGLLTSLAPWTGAPGSHQRTWEEKDGGEAPTKAFISRSRFSYPWSESIRKKSFSTQVRWCEPGAPVQGARLGGKPGKRRRKDSQPPNRANVISLFTRHRRVGCAPNEQSAWRPKQGKRHALVGRQISGLLTSLPPGRVPQVRTSVPGKKKTGAKPPPKLLYPDQGSVTPGVKAFEKNHFQPRYAGANLGHPSRGQGLAGSRESGGERTANRLTELKSFLFSLAIGESAALRMTTGLATQAR